MKIYIAGKVSGEHPADCIEKFGKAQIEIQKSGFTAVNPLQVVNNWETDWQTAMKKCIKALMECDAIYLLPDWQTSKGAKIEFELAHKLDMKILITKP